MGDGRPPMLSEGDVGRCEPEEVRTSMETATDKERPEQRYGWKPDEEEKAEVRPVPPHYRTVYTFTGLQTSRCTLTASTRSKPLVHRLSPAVPLPIGIGLNGCPIC
jgi:hypothetical protein